MPRVLERRAGDVARGDALHDGTRHDGHSRRTSRWATTRFTALATLKGGAAPVSDLVPDVPPAVSALSTHLPCSAVPREPYARAYVRSLMKEIELYIELPGRSCFVEAFFGGRVPQAIKDKAALYVAYMPFIKNGGLFIPTNKSFKVGDEVFMLLSLLAAVPAQAENFINVLTGGTDVHLVLADLRNSKIPDIVTELKEYGIEAIVHDPLGDPREAHEEYKIDITSLDRFTGLDALILAVAHKEYTSNIDAIFARVRDGGVVIDIKMPGVNGIDAVKPVSRVPIALH